MLNGRKKPSSFFSDNVPVTFLLAETNLQEAQPKNVSACWEKLGKKFQ